MSVEFADALVIGSVGVILITWLLSELSRFFSKNDNSLDNYQDFLD